MPHSLLDSDDINMDMDNTSLGLEKPGKILYFSDGVMEDFSDNEVEPENSLDTEYSENSNQLTWGLFLRFKAIKIGSHLLAGADCVGTGLASFLGITTPKFASEIQAFKRSSIQKESGDSENSWKAPNPNQFNEVIINDIKKRNV